MKKYNKLASALFASAFGLMLMTSCEGSDIYTVTEPDWLQAKIDSIKAENEKHKDDEPAEKTVFLNPTSLGPADCSGAWWSEHTENVQVKPNQTVYTDFVNYTSGAANWNNYVIVLCDVSGATEYAVVRADNYGWGSGYEGNEQLTHETSATDWGAWLAAMNGAKCHAAIKNNGDGTADIDVTVDGTDGVQYTQFYHSIKVDSDNLYFNYTIDSSHLVFDSFICPEERILGAEDNSTAFWGAHTPNVKVEMKQSVNSSFVNYTTAANNWNNFCIVLCTEDGTTEYAVVRADNYGWGGGYENNEDLKIGTTVTDWAAWLSAMNEAKVNATITNKGNGYADIDIVMKGNNGTNYTQYYHDIKVNSDQLYFNFTVDNCHLEFSDKQF